jgi:hypothetical protein
MNTESELQKGKLHNRGRSVIFTGILLAMVVAACSPTPTPPGSTPVSPVPSPTVGGSPSGDAKAALLHAIAAHLTAGPYRVEASIVSGATTNAMHGEVILPDRFHLFSSINGGAEREYIIIGSATYAKVGGRWSKLTLDLSGLLANFVNNLDPSTISDVVLVGPESVGGVPALAYTFTYTNNVGGTLITDHDKMWVGVDNGLPIKQVVDGEVSGVVFHNEQTITYDSSITIDAPPV